MSDENSGQHERGTGEPGAAVQIEDNRAAARYELRVDGDQVGRADYRELEDVVVISHVEVDPRFGGQGLAGAVDPVRAGRPARARGVPVLACLPVRPGLDREAPGVRRAGARGRPGPVRAVSGSVTRAVSHCVRVAVKSRL